MKKNYLFACLIFSLFTLSLCAQENDLQLYKYNSVFVNLKGFQSSVEGLEQFNIGYKSVTPFVSKKKLHPNLAHGAEFSMNVFPRADIITLNLAYIFGYEYQIDESFSLFPNIKPFVSATFSEKITYDNNGFEESSEINTDFNFDALVGLEGRYFFGEKKKYGISSEILTSFNGGFGFNLGFIWRKAL